MQAETTTKPTFAELLAGLNTAYLSIASAIQTPELIDEVRQAFPHIQIRTFGRFIPTKNEWRNKLAEYIKQCDGLIVVITESREISKGVGRELQVALGLGKLVVLYNVDSKRWERFAGFDVTSTGDERRTTLRTWQPKAKPATDEQPELAA